MTKSKWSDPYFGVQHLQGIPRSHQITLVDRGTFCEAYQLNLHSVHPFTRAKEHIGTVAECKKIAEQWADALR